MAETLSRQDHISPARAAIGRATEGALLKGGATRVPSPHLSLWTVEHFLSDADCAALIGMIDKDRQPSTLFAGPYEADYRTSESCNLDRWDPRVMGIDRRICTLMGMDERNGETLQGQRYAAGQQFKPHHDFLATDQPYWIEEQKAGGQRTWTAMIYLNEPEAGGETEFPTAGICAVPRKGLLLAWNNMAPDGTPNAGTMHQGKPVLAGVKYIVTKWFRESHWTEMLAPGQR